MYPILLKFGPITIHAYGVMFVLAFLTVTWVSGHVARRWPPALVAISAEQLVDFTCLFLLGGIAGARLFYIALNWEFYAHAPFELIALWHGGLIWYGGFIGGVVAVGLYVWKAQLDFLRVMDQAIPFLALGHAIGRIGCFLNGCCYGKPTAAWYGVQFPNLPLPRIPTQIFEALGLLALYAGLRWLQRPSVLARHGTVFGAYMAGYAVLRFFMESLRGDQTIWWAGLTLQQALCVGVFITGVAMVWLVPGLKPQARAIRGT